MCEPTDSGRCRSVPATPVRPASGAVRSRWPPVPGRSVGAPCSSPAYPLILPRTASPRESLAGLPRAGVAAAMPTHRPAAPRARPLTPSRSLSGSLCALFSDADAGSGVTAEPSPRPAVSEGPPLHSARVSLYGSVKPGDFRVSSPRWDGPAPGCDCDPCGESLGRFGDVTFWVSRERPAVFVYLRTRWGGAVLCPSVS